MKENNKTLLMSLKKTSGRIIEAVIQKAERDCPGALALIGVYGSQQTGDVHSKSDLDLLIVIDDDRGWALGKTFLLRDVGYDLYCTSWERLEADAACASPHLSKLLDADIVYTSGEEAKKRLAELRLRAADILSRPFSKEVFDRADAAFSRAKQAFADMLLEKKEGDCKKFLAEMIDETENTICLLNQTYFKLGLRRRFCELEQMPQKPENFVFLIQNAVASKTAAERNEAGCRLLAAVQSYFNSISFPKKAPSKDDIRGVYEEMVSNWKNKMLLADEINDPHLALINMASLQQLFDELHEQYDMERYDAISGFCPDNLSASAAFFDNALEQFLGEYEKAGLEPLTYETLEEFERDYLSKPVVP